MPYQDHNNQFVQAFTLCMKDKILKNKYKPNECLVLSLTDCKALFQEFFEDFVTFVDEKLLPEITLQEMINMIETHLLRPLFEIRTMLGLICQCR